MQHVVVIEGNVVKLVGAPLVVTTSCQNLTIVTDIKETGIFLARFYCL